MVIGASGPGAAVALELHAVGKRFGATLALDAVDFVVARGEVVALLGANGAGKSTLAKIASGVIQPDSGSVKIAGQAVRLASPSAAREAGVVIVQQRTDQLGAAGLTAAENLVLDGLCGGGIGFSARPARIRRLAATIAAKIGLDLALDADFASLGPAQRQLVAIARAVAADASLLILDEPMASLAASEAAILFGVMDRLRARRRPSLYLPLGDYPGLDLFKSASPRWKGASPRWRSLRARRLPPSRSRIWRASATISCLRPIFTAAPGTSSPIR